MDRLLYVISLFSVGLIVWILVSVRRAHIRVEYSVSWLGAAVTLLLLSRSHWLLDDLAAALGIYDPPIALILLLLVVFLIVFYRFSVIISHLKDNNIALAQKVAILEFQMQSARNHEKTETAAAGQ
ncbi:MAG: DUF2304 domain-containing protein [Bryobacteraceae bacterium]|nr:DUF2304 domain-containing protein [Bryobacteraceae bacterium]